MLGRGPTGRRECVRWAGTSARRDPFDRACSARFVRRAGSAPGILLVLGSPLSVYEAPTAGQRNLRQFAALADRPDRRLPGGSFAHLSGASRIYIVMVIG